MHYVSYCRPAVCDQGCRSKHPQIHERVQLYQQRYAAGLDLFTGQPLGTLARIDWLLLRMNVWPEEDEDLETLA